MTKVKLLLIVSLATMTLPALQAEAQCPGNIASVTPRFVGRSLIVVPVRINHAGPYDFIVDTDSQLTIVDPSLAAELDLKSEATIGVSSVGNYARASVAVLDTLEAGSHIVDKPLVVVHDLSQVQATDPRIRGLLGQNFLSHFDMLIDYGRKALCFDETKQMQRSVQGERIPLVTPQHPASDIPFTRPLLISVHLSGPESRQALLRLDSGSSTPLLYAASQDTPSWMLKRTGLTAHTAGTAQQSFAVLPARDVKVGGRILNRISFVTSLSAGQETPRDEDGLLPTALFRRVFISSADHFVVFDPK